ncbi:MAG: hypothetical protein A2Z16_14865 [Chloroflexi bacterium RBG_16_54_18]|nr:MAG: hypothetical protein A2Z16_14865 [Chloroflexi bacterium RBG_16_54_18]
MGAVKSSSYLFLNGLRLHYQNWNLKEGGSPVVLVHGLAYTARMWDFVAPLLVDLGWMPLAPDQRGHGLSDETEGEYTFDLVVRDLVVFLEMTNLEKPLLVGHFRGGMVVLEYAARVSTGPRSPAGIVLVDGGIGQLSDIPGATWERVRDFLAPSNTTGMTLENLHRHLLKPNPTWTLTDEVLPTMLANYHIDENERVTPRPNYDRHLQILQKIWEFNSYVHYPKIRYPVLMIATCPREPLDGLARLRFEYRQRGVEQAQEIIRDLTVHWMMDTIHDVPLQRPRELTLLIDQFGKSIND